MTTQVYFIRHGETMFNQLNKVQGWCDSPLTKRGISDLKITAVHLAQTHFDQMYSSDLKRAIDTVHLIKDQNKVSKIGKIAKLPAFREVFFGSFEGDDIDQTWDAVGRAAGMHANASVQEIINHVGIKAFREATKKADPRHLAENDAQLEARMQQAIQQLHELSQGLKRILVVSHGDFIKTLGIKYWSEGDGVHDIPFPDNGSVTRGVWTSTGRFEIVDYNLKNTTL